MDDESSKPPGQIDRAKELLKALRESVEFRSKNVDQERLRLKEELRDIIRPGTEEEYKAALIEAGHEEGSEEMNRLMKLFRSLPGR